MSDPGSWRSSAFHAALRMIEGGEPKNLVTRAQPEAADRGASLDAADLTVVLTRGEASDPFLGALGMQVHKWDAAPAGADWTGGTAPSTTERRALICAALGLNEAGAAVLLERRPIFRDETVVITAPWDPWYTPHRAAERAFYWPLYRDHLLNTKGWPEVSVTALDLATSDVVRRLADPTRTESTQQKGLVVGYVQSGKTANFTGVAAKAIDAGYRLVIVMTGTIEMLRAQTQRRMDMEMVGRQNILGDLTESGAKEANVDYQDDTAWAKGDFLDLGDVEPVTGIVRLTQHHIDYKKQFATLKIERFVGGKPLYDPQNLFPTSARLAIVKKNATVLRKLVSDIKANKNAFSEIPVLIIDDESDQASVNTVDPEKVAMAKAEGKDVKERRAINEQIAAMLELMPRAQYVGYTATPFANVFVDPADEQGIFPRDFVIGLPRPNGYMGVDDFHDLGDEGDDVPTLSSSNRLAYVRDLEAEDDDAIGQASELATAIDMFVVTGAVKRWRAEKSGVHFPHHTMLVHSSVRTAAQGDLAQQVKSLWTSAEFTSPAAKARLRALYESDVLPVSEARVEEGVLPPPAFDELAHHIPATISKITEHSKNPVLVVNSDTDIQRNQQELDFDRYEIWRILVGGAKLSRGFTVEGLTVTYFRRATGVATILWTRGFGRSGCSTGSVGLGGGAVVEAGLVA